MLALAATVQPGGLASVAVSRSHLALLARTQVVMPLEQPLVRLAVRPGRSEQRRLPEQPERVRPLVELLDAVLVVQVPLVQLASALRGLLDQMLQVAAARLAAGRMRKVRPPEHNPLERLGPLAVMGRMAPEVGLAALRMLMVRLGLLVRAPVVVEVAIVPDRRLLLAAPVQIQFCLPTTVEGRITD